ncbi:MULTISPECIES: PAS domain-containing sensor histidine kinase [unclassified Sphingomonas]|uniref:hybrid sensor histidine kinase/response regulator n=1 Tax=unclassified Sphingomonas TaxID=196159 RepID=UPI000FEFE635|nr:MULTISPECIES: PAS domain-containing sensor histidine kinase [unclassified Sphingomonas]RKE53766.1 PAS domain-containing protein [Sphingomonas sp. PP-CC-1A-547]TCM10261.1 PAS domain-containing protein [Sphingomonas sp. PP-CC-3G-468]
MTTQTAEADFLTGGGEMAAMIRAHDWSSSPLGPIEHWPQSLRSIVSLMLASEFAMCLAWGPELGFLYNDHYARILHDKHPAALGDRLPDIWAELWPDISPLVDKALAGEASFFENLPLVTNRKGYDERTWFTFSYSPVRDESGAIAGMFCSTYESTDQVQTERALRDERERMSQMFAQAPTFMAMLRGPEHRVELTNPGYDKLIGHREVLGRTVAEALPDAVEQGFVDLLDRVFASGDAFTASGMLYAVQAEPGGAVHDRYVDFVFQPIRDATGTVVGIFVEGADVTDRKRLERDLQSLNADLEQRVRDRTQELVEAQEALRQAQKMEAVGQLTGGIAHDFNNLLQGITGSLEIVQRRVAQGRVGELDRFITGATTAANRAASLTHRLLAFSRRQPLDPRPVKVNPLVTSLEDLLRRTTGEQIELETVLGAGLWTTLCDPNQLENSLLNLVINARDAMPHGGKLTIETCNAHLDDHFAASQRDVRPGHYVCVCVSDTGTGMSADTIAKAFEPFFTTKPIGQGTGLGLSMIYGFARQSEGYARIYSELGQGTTIKLYLPRHYGEAEADEALPGLTQDHVTDAGEIVLVVEDDSVVRALIVEVLGELGYRAVEAHDGPAGLERLRTMERIDLLVTDIGLPGLNGRQVADAGRALRPGLRVLFMTGYAENAALASGFLKPGMSMITKPFAMEALATQIRTMIEG